MQKTVTTKEKPNLSDAAKLKKAKSIFCKIKKYNEELNKLGYEISDQFSVICLFKYGTTDSDFEPIDFL